MLHCVTGKIEKAPRSLCQFETMFSEEEYVAIQDLLERDMLLEDGLRSSNGNNDNSSLIRNYLNQVTVKLKNRPVIEFPASSEWFNSSSPWSSEHLRGRLTLLDFWTYCCVNCMHILPDLEALEQEFEHEENIVVLGVHSAKFDNERVGDNISNAIKRYGIKHPVINDTQALLWHNLSISCWPTVLLCGPDGKPLKFFVGEGNRAKMIEFLHIAKDFFELNSIEKLAELPKIELGKVMTDSPLRYPGKVHVSADKIFISDTGNHRVIVTDLAGSVQHIIGSSLKGSKDGAFDQASFNSPQGLAYAKDCLFVCDTGNHLIRSVDLNSKKVTTIAGNGRQAINLGSQINSSGSLALEISLASPWDIAIDVNDSLVIAMAGSHQLWRLDKQSQVMTLLAGSGKEENRNNSYPLKASFAQPSGLSLTPDGANIYVADSESSSVRVFQSKSGVKNVCGGSKNPVDLFSFGDQDGKGTDAKLQHPLDLAFVPSKEALFIADSYNHKLKIVNDLNAKAPVCSTCDLVQGLNEPGGLCLGSGENLLYVADTNNHLIKTVDISSFQVKELKLKWPDSNSDQVDTSSYKEKLIASDKKPLEINLILEPNFKLNAEAPSSWSLKGTDKDQKGVISADSPIIKIPSITGTDSATLSVKIYLCCGDVCTMKSKDFCIILQENADLSNEFSLSI